MPQSPSQVVVQKHNIQIQTLSKTTQISQPRFTAESRSQSINHRIPPILPYSSLTQSCDVPSDFWCDSYELARRCNVVAQCEQFKRERRPLTVTLMYEALCPFCQRFITNHLANLHSQFGNQIEVELVPWGNSILLRVMLLIFFLFFLNLSDLKVF